MKGACFNLACLRSPVVAAAIGVMLLASPWPAWSQPAEPVAAVHQTGASRQALDEVMADSRFSRWKIRQERISRSKIDPSSYQDQMRNALKPVSDFFDWLWSLRRQNTSSGGSSQLSGLPDGSGLAKALKVAGWVVVGVTLLILAWVLVARWRQRRPAVTKAMSRQALHAAMNQGQALAASSEVWSAHAVELANEKDMRHAYRAMYLSLLAGLHESGRIRYRAQQTNWVYVLGYKGDAGQRDTFADLTTRFDEVWYGQREPDPATFRSIRGRIEQLLGRPAS